MNSNLSAFLNISRWVSAFLVVIGHVRHLVLVDLKNVEDSTIFIKFLYFWSGLGHESVVIFFVISGYLVGGHTLEKWRANGPDLRRYAIARFSRIYTVLIPALVVGLAIDAIGLRWFNLSELYTNSMQYQTDSLSLSISSSMDTSTFFGNLLSLQGILTGSLGSNGPLWSLSYEWWYYCIFALVGAAITSSWNFRFVYLLGAFGLALWLPEKLVIWGSIWLLGLAAHAWIGSGLRCPNPFLGIAIFTLALIISRTSHSVDSVASPESIVRDFGLGLAYVVALAGASRMSKNIPFQNLSRWLASFSYTTYIFHFPALIFSVAFGYQVFGFRFRLQPDGLGLLYLLIVTMLVYCYCYLWFFVAERHTNTVRSYLLAKMPWRLDSEKAMSLKRSQQEVKGV